jgi:hypothetical protein
MSRIGEPGFSYADPIAVGAIISQIFPFTVLSHASIYSNDVSLPPVSAHPVCCDRSRGTPRHENTEECIHFFFFSRSREHDYIFFEYSPPIARPPLPRWQVRVAFRRASRRAIQTRQSLSLPPNPPHPVRPVQHAARVSARRDLPRSPAI